MSSPLPIVAITGARGWVGGCLARHFREHGWKVRELVRKPAGIRSEASEEAAFVLGEEVQAGALEGVEALVHCAYDFAPRTWEEIERVNVRGTARLLEAARTARVQRLVLISTMSAFEGARSLYGRAKLAMEQLASAEGALIVRPGLVYGERAGGMYGSLVAQVTKSAVIPLIGGGDQVLYLVHERDLSELVRRFCSGEISAPGQPVTAAHEQPWTFRQILEEIAAQAGRKPRFVPVPWRAVWAVLKLAELCGLKLSFRSDSLVSLVNQNATPDFRIGREMGFRPRAFASAGEGEM
jgi:nucleoside-diphosphate-sugar epimerase